MKAFVIITSVFFFAAASSAHVIVLDNLEAKDEIKKLDASIEANNERYDEGKSTQLEQSNSLEFLTSDEFEELKEGVIPMPEPEGQKKEEERFYGVLTPEDPADRYDQASEEYLERLRANRATIPDSWDSVALGYVTPAKNQGLCGSCAAFSAVAAFEGAILMATNGVGFDDLDLAEQTLVDCGYDGASMAGCGGAWLHAYHGFITTNGQELPHEYDDEYMNDNPTLTCDSSLPIYHAGATLNASTFTYECTDDDLKKLIMNHGAVSTSIYASDDFFRNYESGIISEECSSEELNHAVTVVGWNNDDEVWIVKNSWGTDWGEDGFFRMKFGICGIGTYCAAVFANFDGVYSPTPTEPVTPEPEAIPLSQTCDISTLYGSSAITGSYFLSVTTADGDYYYSGVTCVDSVCSPTTDEVDNCCIYICGATTC